MPRGMGPDFGLGNLNMPTDREKSREALAEEIRRLRAQVEQLEERERLMRQKERVLYATLDSAADGILAVNEEGHVVFANRQFAHMWHIPPDLIEAGDDNELLDFVLDQLVDPDKFLARVKELYASFSESSDTLHFKDGRVFERHSLPLVVDEDLCGRVWTFHDATDVHGKHETATTRREFRVEVF